MSKRAGNEQHREAQAEERGRLFIVSAPSGAGKSTLCRAVKSRYPQLTYSISFTTRPPRPGDVDGEDYHFIGKQEFEKRIRQGEWAEWAVVHGHYYGTSARELERSLKSGRPVLLDIDVDGTRQILEHFPASITIFILPPSMTELERRLIKRGTDDMSAIRKRLSNAEKEIARKHRYRYIIVNEVLSEAVEEFCAIIEKHQPKLRR